MTSQVKGLSMPEVKAVAGSSQMDNVVFSDLHPRVGNRRSEIISGLQKEQKSQGETLANAAINRNT